MSFLICIIKNMEIEVIRRGSKELWEKIKSDKKPLIKISKNALNCNYYFLVPSKIYME